MFLLALFQAPLKMVQASLTSWSKEKVKRFRRKKYLTFVAQKKLLEIDRQYRSFSRLIFLCNFAGINRRMFRVPFETSFAYGPLFPTKTLALPVFLSRIFSISRFIWICFEIDRRSAVHAATPIPGNVTSGEISVFLIAERAARRPSKSSFIESCESTPPCFPPSDCQRVLHLANQSSKFRAKPVRQRISAEASIAGHL